MQSILNFELYPKTLNILAQDTVMGTIFITQNQNIWCDKEWFVLLHGEQQAVWGLYYS